MRKQSQLRVREAGQVCVLVVQQRAGTDHVRRHNIRKQLLNRLLITLCGQRYLNAQRVLAAAHLELVPILATQRCELLPQAAGLSKEWPTWAGLAAGAVGGGILVAFL